MKIRVLSYITFWKSGKRVFGRANKFLEFTGPKGQGIFRLIANTVYDRYLDSSLKLFAYKIESIHIYVPKYLFFY